MRASSDSIVQLDIALHEDFAFSEKNSFATREGVSEDFLGCGSFSK